MVVRCGEVQVVWLLIVKVDSLAHAVASLVDVLPVQGYVHSLVRHNTRNIYLVSQAKPLQHLNHAACHPVP